MNAHTAITETDQYRALQWLNAGVLYVSRALDVTVCNELGREFLERAAPTLQPAPLESCLCSQGELYRIIVDLISFGHEPKDTVMLWEIHGRVRHVLLDVYAHRDGKGNMIGAYLVIKDLGNMAALEQHMLRTDKLATVGKIAAGIAHEIRNPLTTLKGFLQVFELRFSSDETLEGLVQQTQVMMAEVDKVNDVVSELLLLSKPREMDKKPCNLAAVLEAMRPVIAEQSAARNVHFEFSAENDVRVLADQKMIKQLISNLVKNAVEAMESGGNLRIKLRLSEGWAVLDVSDTGPGIPYYQVDKIFDVFYTTKEKGTGLGLPICQTIVSNHGGEIRISSKGFGTTFSVYLPRLDRT